MKKIILILLLFGVTVVFGTLDLNTKQMQGQRISTVSVQDRPIQIASVTADASALTVATENWDDNTVLFVPIPVEWSNVTLSFYGYGDGTGVGDPNDTTFSFDVYVCDIYGGAECIVSGSTGTIGAQQLSVNPATGASLASGAPDPNYCWSDDLNEGTLRTTSTVAYSDYQSTDGLAKMKFDRGSAFGIYVRIYDMTAQLVTSVTCVMNGYNQ